MRNYSRLQRWQRLLNRRQCSGAGAEMTQDRRRQRATEPHLHPLPLFSPYRPAAPGTVCSRGSEAGPSRSRTCRTQAPTQRLSPSLLQLNDVRVTLRGSRPPAAQARPICRPSTLPVLRSASELLASSMTRQSPPRLTQAGDAAAPGSLCRDAKRCGQKAPVRCLLGRPSRAGFPPMRGSSSNPCLIHSWRVQRVCSSRAAEGCRPSHKGALNAVNVKVIHGGGLREGCTFTKPQFCVSVCCLLNRAGSGNGGSTRSRCGLTQLSSCRA